MRLVKTKNLMALNDTARPMRLVRSLKRGSRKIYCGDALDLLRSLTPESAAVVFLDPPFNLGKSYKDSRDGDSMPPDLYTHWLSEVVAEVPRILMEGGALFLYHIPLQALTIGGQLLKELEFRHWIAISMKNGFVYGDRLYPAHYALLYFTKGDPRYFARPRIKPNRCRHCGDLIKDYGGYWPLIQKKGLNLSDFWEDISPVRHAARKNRASNELPSLLVDRVINIAGRKGQLFVDPFCGSGAPSIAAARRGMRIIAGDRSKTYADLTAKRLWDVGSTKPRTKK
jgi:site-specific DNA-methyltransferase (adenine-specific)